MCVNGNIFFTINISKVVVFELLETNCYSIFVCVCVCVCIVLALNQIFKTIATKYRLRSGYNFVRFIKNRVIRE